MSFPYKKVAVFGATSGIGRALAERFIENGIFVVAIGRRKERLAELVHQYGHEKVQASTLDIVQHDSIPNFVTNITGTHPDLDLILLNSGLQQQMDFSKPDTIDLEKVKYEFDVNYLAPIALTKAFLPFLMSNTKAGKPAGLMYTTSGLALVPSPKVINYSATKAAMHSFILSLRVQLADSGVKVLELVPPAVQTELHGEEGKDIGMPLKDFIDESWAGMQEGKDQIPVGMAVKSYDKFEWLRQDSFKVLANMQKNE